MTCPPTDDLLPDEPDPAMRAHLERCASCRNKRALYRPPSAEIDAPSADLPPDLHARLLQMLDASWAAPLEGGPLAVEDRHWLGTGERGPTFSVFDRSLQRRVALKQVHGIDAAQVRAVKSALDDLGHPALVGWLEVRPGDDGATLLTRNLARGVGLDEALERATRHRALQLVARIVSALWALHRVGIAHGGLGPSNVWVEPHGRLVVVDAGIGGLPPRSPWRAPELGPGEASPAGDTFALARMVERWAPQLLAGDRTSPHSVAALLHRMLSPDPADRPTSEAILAAVALEQGFGTGEPTRYERGERLDRGGMGELFRAWDPVLRREVALKCLPRGAASFVQIGRFLAEARVAAQLEHPNVLAVHDLGWMDDGAPYFVMKLVEGRELGRVIDELHAGGPIRLSQLVESLARLCDAVAYAHSRGVLHCDLKPRNVLIGPYQDLQLIDWGAARLFREDDRSIDVGDDIADMDRCAGTPGFMAPEQAEARTDAMGPPTDVFSLGRILYQVLTGQPPPVDGSCPPIPVVAPHVPRELVSIADETQHADPARRYPSADALGADLRAWVAGERVSVHAYGLADELERRTRGRRAWILLAPALALVVGTAVWFALLGFHTTRLAEARERERQGLVLAEQARLAWVAHDRVEAERRAAQAVALADTPEGRGLLVRLGRVAYPRLAATPAPWPAAGPACPAPVARLGDDLVLAPDTIARDVTSDPTCDPAGTRVAVARGGEVDVWNLSPLVEDAILEGHVRGVAALAFSHDGRRLATADGVGQVRQWDARGAELARLSGHGAVRRLAFADRSKQLLVDGDVPRAWDLDPPVGPERVENVVPLVAVGWPGALTTLDQHGRWRQWDAATGRFAGREAEDVLAAALGPDGQTLAVVDASGALRIGEVQVQVPTGARAVAWQAGTVVTGGADGVLRTFDATGRPTGATAGGPGVVSLSAVGDALLVGRETGAVELGARSWRQVTAVAATPAAIVLSIGSSGELRWIDAAGPHEAQIAELGGPVEAVAISPDGGAVAALAADHTVRLFARSGQHWAERSRTVVALRSPPGLAFSPDGRILAVIGLGGTLELWDAAVIAAPASALVAGVDARYGRAP